MLKRKFYVVNSFAVKPFGGNPAGVFPNANGLDEETMQAIARQLNLVETVFIFPSPHEQVDFELRYFTPKKELPIAGHPTIAAWLALAYSNTIEPVNRTQYHQQTKAGIQEIQILESEGGYVVTMEQPSPKFLAVIEDRNSVADIFGITLDDMIPELPIQAVSTGLGHIIFGVKSLQALMKVRRNIAPLRALCHNHGVQEAQVFCFETYEAGFDLHTRNICPREGIEDPACGVGNGALLAYLMKYHFREEDEIHLQAEQGYIEQMPSKIDIYGYRRSDGSLDIWVGGSGLLMITGEFFA